MSEWKYIGMEKVCAAIEDRDEMLSKVDELEAALAEAKLDSQRLDTMLSWRGIDWLFAWFQDAENTNPPTRDDIDKLEEQD